MYVIMRSRSSRTLIHTVRLINQLILSVHMCKSCSGKENPIECWLGIVENNIDRRAFRPDDVVYAVTGDSIEIVHSDAEG